MKGHGRAMQTIEQHLRASVEALTRTERQLALHIVRGYPVAALGSITALAKAAEVSTPTVVRLVQKLGFKGYPDFQAAIRAELEERLISPLVKHDRWAGSVPQTHILNRFADAVVGNLQATLGQIDMADVTEAYDVCVKHLAAIDPVGRRRDLFAGMVGSVGFGVLILLVALFGFLAWRGYF